MRKYVPHFPLSNVKKRVEDGPNFCGLLKISEMYDSTPVDTNSTINSIFDISQPPYLPPTFQRGV